MSRIKDTGLAVLREKKKAVCSFKQTTQNYQSRVCGVQFLKLHPEVLISFIKIFFSFGK